MAQAGGLARKVENLTPAIQTPHSCDPGALPDGFVRREAAQHSCLHGQRQGRSDSLETGRSVRLGEPGEVVGSFFSLGKGRARRQGGTLAVLGGATGDAQQMKLLT